MRTKLTVGSAAVRLCTLAGMTLLSAAAAAVPVHYDLTFATDGQSLWASGASTQLDETKFIGASWDNASNGVDLIVGDADTTLPNPLRAAYDVSFAACRGLGFSSATCINGQAARAPVPALGSRPSVRSCSTFNVGCQAARLGDLAARAAYDTAFAACDAVFAASVCRSGQSAQVFVPALGTAPAPTFDLDTRTGVAATAVSDGRVGIELGMQIDSGSVAATVEYRAILDIPDDVTALDRSQAINFNANSLLAGGTLDTTFPTLALSADAIMELSGSVTGEACAIGAGCVTGGKTFNITERAPIVSFNQDGEGGVLLLGQSPSFWGLPAATDGFPLDFDVAGQATVTLHLPQPDATGGANAVNAPTQTLRASGQDDLLDLILDLDNIAATAALAPGLFGDSVSFGPLTLGYDIVNVTMGPTIDLAQNFELDPTLYVSLAFDQAVMIGGQLVTSLTSAWDSLPGIIFPADRTTVTPTFFLGATLLNETLLDFDLQFFIDLLQVNYNAGVLGSGTFGIGNVLDQAVNLFKTPALFSNLFDLGGFNLQIGNSFVIDFLTGASGPASSIALTAENPVVLMEDNSPPTAVPEPGTWALLLAGLLLLLTQAGRNRRARRPSAAEATRRVA
jgi:hypothetical protein